MHFNQARVPHKLDVFNNKKTRVKNITLILIAQKKFEPGKQFFPQRQSPSHEMYFDQEALNTKYTKKSCVKNT